MGGAAFAKHLPPLPTPRMPLEIYSIALQQTLSILRSHYTHVANAIEGPAKDTYGDVDILVAGAATPAYDSTKDRQTTARLLAKLLNAKAYIHEKGNPTINFAVPWPSLSTSSNPEEKAVKDDRYVQVDIHYCLNEERFKWELFHSAHGDLWNMLGSTIRPLGLTVNDKGLYLRIEAIEKLDKKKSQVFLTSDPALVLQFLGLDEAKWWAPFPTRQQMFEYAASSRCFWAQDVQQEDASSIRYGDVIADLKTVQVQGQEGGEEGKRKLKHNDRQRMAKRPIFAQWIEEFIPTCRTSGKYTNEISREQVKMEAFEAFGVAQEYEEKLSSWTLARHKDELWRVAIKDSVPVDGVDPVVRAAVLRMFKAVIIEGASVEGIEVPKQLRCGDDGFWDLDAVSEFVAGNWKAWGAIAFRAQEEKAREAMKAKAERKKSVQDSLQGVLVD